MNSSNSRGVLGGVRVHYGIGKAVALALFSVSLSSCGNPFNRDPKVVDAQSLGVDASGDVRAFYEGRNWQAAWDGKTEKQILEIIDGAPTHGLKRELFLKGDPPRDRSERASCSGSRSGSQTAPNRDPSTTR